MARLEVDEVEVLEPAERFLPWHVSWSGVFVGALSALALLLVFGLTGIAVGAHQVGQRLASWHEFRVTALAFAVFGSFLSLVLGGWAAARIAGTRRAETAMLHGAIAWLVTVPALLFFARIGAGGYLGVWYGGLAGPAPWAPAPVVESAAAALAARNAALGVLTALLLGLAGSVIGGWMASGERMSLRFDYVNRPHRRHGRAWGGVR